MDLLPISKGRQTHSSWYSTVVKYVTQCSFVVTSLKKYSLLIIISIHSCMIADISLNSQTVGGVAFKLAFTTLFG